jgi:hypothetical protein
MRFRLSQKSANQVITKVHVLNEKDDVIGSINVPPAQAGDLLAHWAGPADRGEPQPAAKLKPAAIGRMSRQAILRGC